MLKRVISAVLGTRHEREAKRIQPIVDAINEQYARLQSVSDEALRGQSERLRGFVRDRTAEIEAKVADLKQRKHDAAYSIERDAIGSCSASAVNGDTLRPASLETPALSIGSAKSAPITEPENPAVAAIIWLMSSVPAQRSRYRPDGRRAMRSSAIALRLHPLSMLKLRR